MISSPDRNAAWLSLLWPGLGQFAQGRWAAGSAFAVWAALSAIALAAPGSLGMPPRLLGADLVVATVFAVVEAYRFKRSTA
jgi:hypothetical protein